MPLYTISNGSSNSSRIADLVVTKDATNLATTLESFTLILEAQSPNVWKANLTYTAKESNQVKVYDNVFNSVTDTMDLDIVTTAWTLTLDYTAASANPDLVFNKGVTALNPSKLTLYFDKTMIHPKLTTEFWFN